MEALTLDDLKALRQDGLMETLREKLRIERKYLRSVSVADFQNSTELFGKKVLDIVGEYSNEHRTLKSSSRKRIAKSSLALGGSAALGIAGLACPSIEVLAIIGTATGLLLGGKSVLDLVNDFKKSNNEKQISESNPVSILFGAYERYMKLLNDENKEKN